MGEEVLLNTIGGLVYQASEENEYIQVAREEHKSSLTLTIIRS